MLSKESQGENSRNKRSKFLEESSKLVTEVEHEGESSHNKNRGNVYMSYAKEEALEYGEVKALNQLKISEESWTSKIFEKVRRNAFISSVFFAFLILSTVNLVLIYNFMKILQTI